MTKTPIATACTYDDRELASTGYDIEIYDDYAILVYHSNWQGSRPGTTYKAVPPPEVFAAAQRKVNGDQDNHKPDLHSAVTTWLQSAYEDEWTLLRTGSKIP
jgi:hypothetical protein